MPNVKFSLISVTDYFWEYIVKSKISLTICFLLIFNSSTFLHPTTDSNASTGYSNFSETQSSRFIQLETNLVILINDLKKLDDHINNTYTTEEKLNVSRKRLTRNLKIKENRYEEIKSSKKRELEYQIQEIEREINDYKIELMNTGCSC